MKKLVNGELLDMTSTEIAEVEARDAEIANEMFNEMIKIVRQKRNQLLAETDFYALSDQTLTTAMSDYRQQLRDATNGLTTVEEINSYQFPTKP